MENKKTIYAIVGPTCTYKTEVALALADNHPFEIISADSRLVYKHMNIGTSKPTVEERKSIPHHMIDLVEPNDHYSVGVYKTECEKLIDDMFSRNKIPLFVGGTGLYLNAVLSGLSIPKVEPDKEFRDSLYKLTNHELYAKLAEKDSVAASKIHQNDSVRLVRALEVIEKTGEQFSKQTTKNELPFDVKWIGLTYEDRNKHAERFNLRAMKFLTNGFIEEVKSLLDRYGELQLFKRSIGYYEVIKYLQGEMTEGELVERITLSTRQFAKRQRTWFRANNEIEWVMLDDLDVKSLINQVNNSLRLT